MYLVLYSCMRVELQIADFWNVLCDSLIYDVNVFVIFR